MIYACKGCTDRQVGCHITCEKYIEQKALHEQEKAERDKQKAERGDISRYTYEQVMKAVFRREGRTWK